ncbi:MAG TPA: protein kinase [Asanoa sp.]
MRTDQVLDGRYRLEERLGAGGMSVVWRAHDQVLERPVAVKVLAGSHVTDPAARERIRLEAQAAARLWHPHVTNVYDYGESTGDDGACVPYVVMELLPGRTLAQRLADGPLPPRAALRILSEVAAALAAAHAQDLVHRDVKPSNVMLTPSGAKVVDFGIAAVAGRSELESDGELLGTPAYLAPERLTGGEVSPASDVYALGLLIYRSLTNRLPWLAETTTQMLHAHVYVDPEPLPAIERVPPSVNEVCDRCLAKNPADRPPASEVAAALGAAAGVVLPPEDEGPVTGGAPMPAPITDPAANGTTQRVRARVFRRRTAVAAALVLLLVAAGLALAFLLPDDRRGGAAAAPEASPTATPAPSAATPSAGADRPLLPGGSVPAAVESPGGSGSDSGPGGGSGSGSSGPGGGSGSGSGSSSGSGGGSGSGSGGGDAATAAPSPGPAVPIVTLGGVVTVRCIGDQAEVVGISLGAGFLLDSAESGPADTVRVTLLSPLHRTEVTARCEDGRVVNDVTEAAR